MKLYGDVPKRPEAQLTNRRAIYLVAKGRYDDVTPKQIIAAWQTLIDTGMCWKLGGWYKRRATHMIDIGLCRRGAVAA